MHICHFHLDDCEEEHKMNDDPRFAVNEPRRREKARTGRQSGGLAVLVAAAALGLAACGGSSSPHVASLGTGSSGNSATTGSANSTTAPSKESPAQLLGGWASCMRSHGDPGQADPTIDANKVIHVTISPGLRGGVFGYSGQSGSGPGRFCLAYMHAAMNALGGGQARQAPSLAQQLKYARCMRAHGVPDYPDPNGGGGAVSLGSGDMNPNSPRFQKANKLCYQRTGVQGVPGSENQPGDVVPNFSGNGGSGADG
jgi:hypothetical protein